MKLSVNKMLHRRILVRAIAIMALAAGVSGCASVPEITATGDNLPLTPFKQSCTATHPQYGTSFAFARIEIEGEMYLNHPYGSTLVLVKSVRSTPLLGSDWFAGQPPSELAFFTDGHDGLISSRVKTPNNGQVTYFQRIYFDTKRSGLPWGTAKVHYIEAGHKKSASCEIKAKHT